MDFLLDIMGLKSSRYAFMVAERTSFHCRSQTVLQEIRDALPTELIRVRGLNELAYQGRTPSARE